MLIYEVGKRLNTNKRHYVLHLRSERVQEIVTDAIVIRSAHRLHVVKHVRVGPVFSP